METAKEIEDYGQRILDNRLLATEVDHKLEVSPLWNFAVSFAFDTNKFPVLPLISNNSPLCERDRRLWSEDIG